MTDEQAERVLLAVQELAIAVRDEGPDAVRLVARKILRYAGGDPVAALAVAAAAIHVDRPVDAWWDGGKAVHRGLRPCGTPSAYARHLARREKPCDECRAAHTQVRAARKRRQNGLSTPSTNGITTDVFSYETVSV